MLSFTMKTEYFFFFFPNVKDAPHLVSLCLNKFTGTCSSDQPEISVPKETFFFPC